MALEPIIIGECCIYGTWDDVTDNQFIVIWGESGNYATVLILSGYDYGGGVTHGSANIPYKEVEEILDSGKYIADIKRDLDELVTRYLKGQN